MKLDIKNCARCNNDHKQLEFVEFKQNPIVDPDENIWSHWAMCPINQEPILLTVVDRTFDNKMIDIPVTYYA